LDYVTVQGMWLCYIAALATLMVESVSGSPGFAVFEFLFFFLAGVGVRRRSRVASNAAFLAYLLSGIVLQRYSGNGFSILKIIGLGLLFANVRGNWLSARWVEERKEPPPVPLDDTFFDKLGGRLPIFLWPRTRYVFLHTGRV